MTADSSTAREGKSPRETNGLLRVLAVFLLIAGFPSFLFGLFLAMSQGPDGIGSDVAFRFSVYGLFAVLCALGIKRFVRGRDGWF
jgi:hypothetical protein